MNDKIVYVLGELNPDMIMTGKDLLPEFNREKLLDSCEIVLGSSSAITAANLAGLGLDVRFVSVVGDDPFGRFCLDELRRSGIDTRYVSVDPRWSTGVTLSFSTTSDRALMTHLGAIPTCIRHTYRMRCTRKPLACILVLFSCWRICARIGAVCLSGQAQRGSPLLLIRGGI